MYTYLSLCLFMQEYVRPTTEEPSFVGSLKFSSVKIARAHSFWKHLNIKQDISFSKAQESPSHPRQNFTEAAFLASSYCYVFKTFF